MNNKEINKFVYAGFCDIGVNRKINEDSILIKTLDETTMFAIIGDGHGQVNETSPNPAALVANFVGEFLEEAYNKDKEFLKSNIKNILKMAYFSANRYLGSFKYANEELYGGFASCLTTCFLDKDRLTIAHSGNTRCYLLRGGKPKQITTDHTKAWEKMIKGEAKAKDYYTDISRLEVTSALGLTTENEVEIKSGKFIEGDILILTTKGVHDSVRDDVIPELVLYANTPTNAARVLIDAAKSTQYNDNMSAIVIANASDLEITEGKEHKNEKVIKAY